MANTSTSLSPHRAVGAADAHNAADPMAVGDRYLDGGKLCVAKFNADGTGTWIELVPDQHRRLQATQRYKFADAADIAINTRLAADAVGATRWTAHEWNAREPRQRRDLLYADQQQQTAASAPRAAGICPTQPAPRLHRHEGLCLPRSGNPNGAPGAHEGRHFGQHLQLGRSTCLALESTADRTLVNLSA